MKKPKKDSKNGLKSESFPVVPNPNPGAPAPYGYQDNDLPIKPLRSDWDILRSLPPRAGLTAAVPCDIAPIKPPEPTVIPDRKLADMNDPRWSRGPDDFNSRTKAMIGQCSHNIPLNNPNGCPSCGTYKSPFAKALVEGVKSASKKYPAVSYREICHLDYSDIIGWLSKDYRRRVLPATRDFLIRQKQDIQRRLTELDQQLIDDNKLLEQQSSWYRKVHDLPPLDRNTRRNNQYEIKTRIDDAVFDKKQLQHQLKSLPELDGDYQVRRFRMIVEARYDLDAYQAAILNNEQPDRATDNGIILLAIECGYCKPPADAVKRCPELGRQPRLDQDDRDTERQNRGIRVAGGYDSTTSRIVSGNKNEEGFVETRNFEDRGGGRPGSNYGPDEGGSFLGDLDSGDRDE